MDYEAYDHWARLSMYAFFVFGFTLIPAVLASPWFFLAAVPAGAVFLYCGYRMDVETGHWHG